MMEFVLYAVLAGLGLSLITAPLGCFIVWRRMAYFGDTLAHSALLGVGISLWVNIHPSLGVSISCLFIALGLLGLHRRPHLSSDTLLGILSHSALALGLVVTSILPGVRVDLMSYLFGNILTVTESDLLWVAGILVFSLPMLLLNWNKLLSFTCSEDLAIVDGYSKTQSQLILMGLTALVVATGIKIIGMLLITAMLIVPAAAARRLAHSPEVMALLASMISGCAVLMGIALSFYWDTPAGPSIVLSACLFFLVSYSVPMKRSV